MTISVRLARKSDAVPIQNFIREAWKKNHIFVTSDSFFEYEMCRNKIPNFVLAEEAGSIVGLVGFICNRDTLIESDLYLVMFRVLKIEGGSFLGIKILEFVRGLTQRGVHTIGANENVLSYYRFCGFKTGYLKHYYWMSTKSCVRRDFSAYDIPYEDNSLVESDEVESSILRISHHDAGKIIEKIDINDCHPLSKSKKFFLKRFIAHPIYRYQLFQIPGLPEILVVREASVNNHRIWRVVDFFGAINRLPTLCQELICLAVSESISVVDLYVSGVGQDAIIKSGLSNISEDVVVPNHLEPLVMQNIAISYVTSCSHEPVFFRGDCDQDRPSA